LRRKFNNQQNAQHTFAVHYKHLRPALQLLVNFKLFSYGVVHKWRHTLTGERGSPVLWQIVTRGKSVVLWCHTSRFDMHATRSRTRKERCGGPKCFYSICNSFLLQPMRKFLSISLMD